MSYSKLLTKGELDSQSQKKKLLLLNVSLNHSRLVQFHPDIDRLQLFSSSMDCSIRIWDLSSSQCVCVLQSHYSAVTSLSFSLDGDTMVRYDACS